MIIKLSRERELRKIWDKYADLYGQPGVAAYKTMWSWNCQKKIVRRNIVPDATLSLDIGCDAGDITRTVAEKSRMTIGLDISSKLLSLAKKQNNIQNVVKGTLDNLPFEGETFTQIVCVNVIQHISNIYNAMMEMSRVLKEEGLLIITFSNYNYYPFQRRMSRGEDLSSKSRTWILHRNDDVFSALQCAGFELTEVKKIPYSFFPSFAYFAIGAICVKRM